jgi:hypothetical protein
VTFTVLEEAVLLNEMGRTTPEESHVYVVVPVLIDYHGDETYLHVWDRSTLVAADGTQYLPDLRGMVAVKETEGEENPFITLELLAGQSAQGFFVYHVPEDHTHGLHFQLSLAEAPVIDMKIGL